MPTQRMTERQSLLQAFYQNDAINKEQYELLKQKADKDSADAQYQTAVELYKSQGNLNSLAIGLMETTQERTSNMLTGMLNGTQTLRDGMIGLFSSLTQSVIKNLVDMAAQALITNTILKSIMGIAPLQDAVDLDMATEVETALLLEWKKYRVLLNRVDTSKPEWPTAPNIQAS